MATSQAVFIGGRSGVGKSSTAAALHDLLSAGQIRHAVIEGDYFDLAYPDPSTAFPGTELAARNLNAVWRNYRDLGYRRLIYTNTACVVEIDSLAAAMGDGPSTTGVLLRAELNSIRDRLAKREHGESLDRHLRRSSEAAAWLDAETPDSVLRVDTDLLSPEQVAVRILEYVRWDLKNV